MRLVALHEGDAKLTGGVALACRQVHGGTGADQRNERVALLAERLPGSSGETGDLSFGLELVEGESLLLAAAPRPAQLLVPIAGARRLVRLGEHEQLRRVRRTTRRHERRLGTQALRAEDERATPASCHFTRVAPLRLADGLALSFVQRPGVAVVGGALHVVGGQAHAAAVARRKCDLSRQWVDRLD